MNKIQTLIKYIQTNENKHSYDDLINMVEEKHGKKIAAQVAKEYLQIKKLEKQDGLRQEHNKTLTITQENWNDIKQYRNTPEQQVNTTVGVLDQYLPKKAAALEICKETKQTKITSIGLIISVFVVAIASALNMWGGAAAAGIFSIFAAMMIKKTINKMKYFKSNYDVEA